VLEEEYEKLYSENQSDPILKLGMEETGRKEKAKLENIERCGVQIPMLDLNEIAVQKEIGSQPNTSSEGESSLSESLYSAGSSQDSKY